MRGSHVQEGDSGESLFPLGARGLMEEMHLDNCKHAGRLEEAAHCSGEAQGKRPGLREDAV